MRFFDPHIHMFSRTTDDYEAMAAAGIRAVIEPAFWLGQPRTHIGSFIDYFNTLVGWERFRASQFGITHFCTMGLNPKEANDQRVNEGVMEVLPRYLEKDGVVAVGEIGLDDNTPVEENFMLRQMEMAKEHGLPVLIHTPHRDKKQGTIRTIDLVRESGIAEHMVVVDHNNEETLPIVLESECWAGHSIYPDTKMTEERMVALLQQYGTDRMIVNSAADWGKSDPLKVPKTARAMLAAGMSEEVVDKVLWQNPAEFFGQSGRLDLSNVDEVGIDQTQLFEGNSVLRGQAPMKVRPGGE